MEPLNDPSELISNKSPGAQADNAPLHEDDPALEREFRELAQWLLDVYLWKLHEERKKNGGKIDNHPPPASI